MALWLVRAGRRGEYEQRFLSEGRIYLTWDELDGDLRKQESRPQLRDLLKEVYPAQSAAQIGASLGQIWVFVHDMKIGDWVATPSKFKPAILFGEIKGDYDYHAKAERPYYHSRDVKWFATDIPRTVFDEDILFALVYPPKTISRISEDVDARVRALAQTGWKATAVDMGLKTGDGEEESSQMPWDLEDIARAWLAKRVQAKFKGHGMAHLVAAILRARGYKTYVSPPGPDQGIDVLAAPAPLGFGNPRICVQVKSGNSPEGRPTIDQLRGAMTKVEADQGLLVSWGGFRLGIDKASASQFFHVRLWDQDDVIDHLLACYNDLDDDMRAKLPLKQIWTLAAPDDHVATDTDLDG
jgi:restriction system protein